MLYSQVLMYKRAAEEAQEQEKSKKAKKKQFKAAVKEQRTNPQTRSNRRQTGKEHSQLLGPITNKVVAGGVGALLGGTIGGIAGGATERIPGGSIGGALKGAYLGGTGGVAAATATDAVAFLIGALRRVRTNKQQEKYEASKGATVANYLLPGAAAYNAASTLAANRDTLARLRQGKM